MLKGIAVVDLSTAQKLGSVSRIILDPNNRRMLGVEIKSGRFAAPQVVLAEKVRSFGHDAITIDDSTGLNERAHFPALTDMPGLDEFTGTKIVTDSGTLLGQIKDVLLSPDGRQITEYEFTSGGLGALIGLGTKMLRATPQQRFGGTILTVPESDAGAEHQAGNQSPA